MGTGITLSARRGRTMTLVFGAPSQRGRSYLAATECYPNEKRCYTVIERGALAPGGKVDYHPRALTEKELRTSCCGMFP